MEILVITNSCSKEKYDEICKLKTKPSLDPQQKFFRLLISGFAANKSTTVTAITALPVSASSVRQKVFRLEDDYSEKGVKYRYLPFKNGKILRYFSLLFSSRKYVREWCKNKKTDSSVILVDPLIPAIAIPARIIAQHKGIKTVAVVTDIPSLSSNMKGRKESLIKRLFVKLYQRMADKDLKKYDAYIPLTTSINAVVNPIKKPSVVIEGFADITDKEIARDHENYVMYAGGVYEKYGLKTLVEAFLEIPQNDVKLYVFGEGPYVEELERLQSNYPQLKYMGCVSSETVVSYEKRALLLVNPRPTDEEFAKYSFPSKTMEYMLSGTAVVSTQLPGIPREYYDYMYSFPGYDRASIRDTLAKLLTLPRNELIELGEKAHFFVLHEKNNQKMALKVIAFITESVLV